MNIRLPLLSLLLISMAGCGGDMKSALGMKRSAPDEFVVISNPPLKEPPEFNLVSPTSTQVPDMQEQGIIVELSPSELNPPDRSFLENLGSSNHSSTKAMIDKEHQAKKNEHDSKGSVRKTLSRLRGDHEEHVIDPIAERKRIKENMDTGTPIHEGEVKNKSKSTLDKLWGN